MDKAIIAVSGQRLPPATVAGHGIWCQMGLGQCHFIVVLMAADAGHS